MEWEASAERAAWSLQATTMMMIFYVDYEVVVRSKNDRWQILNRFPYMRMVDINGRVHSISYMKLLDHFNVEVLDITKDELRKQQQQEQRNINKRDPFTGQLITQ